MFRNCTLFSSLFSVLLFFLAFNPYNRKSGNNETCLQGINYISEWHKHKLVSPSLLTVLILQFVPYSSIWLDLVFFNSYGIEQKVYIRMLLTNWVDCRGSWVFFPMSLVSQKKLHSHFEITAYCLWQYGPEKGMEVEKNLLSSCQIIIQVWHGSHLLNKWHTWSWMLLSNSTWL